MVSQADRHGHDRECRVGKARGGKYGTACDEEILDTMYPAVAVDYAGGGRIRHSRGPNVMTADTSVLPDVQPKPFRVKLALCRAGFAQRSCNQHGGPDYAVDVLLGTAPVNLYAVESELVPGITQHHTAVGVRSLLGIEVKCVGIRIVLADDRRQLAPAENPFSHPHSSEIRKLAPINHDIPAVCRDLLHRAHLRERLAVLRRNAVCNIFLHQVHCREHTAAVAGIHGRGMTEASSK